MLTTACCLIVRKGLGLDLVSRWLVLCIYYFQLSSLCN